MYVCTSKKVRRMGCRACKAPCSSGEFNLLSKLIMFCQHFLINNSAVNWEASCFVSRYLLPVTERQDALTSMV